MDPHKDHNRHNDPHEEKDDQSSLTIILEEDSNDDEVMKRMCMVVEYTRCRVKTKSKLTNLKINS